MTVSDQQKKKKINNNNNIDTKKLPIGPILIMYCQKCPFKSSLNPSFRRRTVTQKQQQQQQKQ
jgi:hypothetical protein